MQKNMGRERRNNMNELKIKKLEKITDKLGALQDELQILFDAELSYKDRYQAAEEVCRNMQEAHRLMTGAVTFLVQAKAEAELEDVQDNIQMDLDHLMGMEE